MKKLIGIFCILAGFAYGQTANDYAVFYNGTNLFSKAGGAWNGVNMQIGSNATLRVNKAEAYFTNDTAQAFTAAAGFTMLTNYQMQTVGHFTSTGSNLTTHVAGDIVIRMSASYESSAANNVTDCHLYTNNVEVQRIGWTRKLATFNDQGSAGANGMLLNVPSGTTFSAWMKCDKNSTLTFDHFSLILLQQ